MAKLAPVFKIPRSRIVEREPEVLWLCRGKKILHVGCADYPYTLQRGEALLHKRLSSITDQLWGIDLCAEGCSLLKKMGFGKIIEGDIVEFAKDFKKEKFDIILAGEVIEHTANASDFLKGIAKSMSKSTELILTTINTPSLMSFFFSVANKEKVHPDHNYYFSYYTMKHFIEKCGFIPLEIYYYKVNNTIIDKLASIVKKMMPALSDGIIVRAKLQ